MKLHFLSKEWHELEREGKREEPVSNLLHSQADTASGLSQERKLGRGERRESSLNFTFLKVSF